MKFAPGDHVHVANFGKAVVREVRNGGRYLVEVKGRAMIVAESQLAAMDARQPRRRETSLPVSAGVHTPHARGHVATALDLHGMTTDAAVAAVDAFLNDAILASHSEVHIIHGRSGGRLKSAVHERLRELTAVRSFRVDDSNPGVTVVAL